MATDRFPVWPTGVAVQTRTSPDGVEDSAFHFRAKNIGTLGNKNFEYIAAVFTFYHYLIIMGNLSFKYKFWIENPDGESIFGDGKYRLFKAIEETGSLKYAVAKLNLSYRKTWDKLREIEEKLGYPVLETTQGGPTGGGTSLTPEGKKLMRAFELLHSLCDKYICDMIRKVSTDFSESKP